MRKHPKRHNCFVLSTGKFFYFCDFLFLREYDREIDRILLLDSKGVIYKGFKKIRIYYGKRMRKETGKIHGYQTYSYPFTPEEKREIGEYFADLAHRYAE